MDLEPSDLLGPAEVCLALGRVSRVSLKRWRDAGTFPKPWRELKMGPVWLRSDVEEWARARSAPHSDT